jgi:signal recognition particle subunit SRP19
MKQVGPKGAVSMGNPLDDLTIPPDEMIQLPPPVDKSLSQIWPLSETFTMNYERFSVIYPNYLDSTKTVKQGRRISAVEAVEKPTVMDIGSALQLLKMRHAVQPYKGYPRDPESQWENLGRVLVDLPKSGGFDVDGDENVVELGVDGSFDINAEDQQQQQQHQDSWNKKQLLREIAARIPQLTSRKERLAREKMLQDAEARRAEEEASLAHKAASQKASVAVTGNKKKIKGKKKR